MDVEVVNKDKYILFRINDHLKVHNCQGLKAIFTSNLEEGCDHVLDFSEVVSIDEVGVCCLFYCLDQAKKMGSTLYIYNAVGYVKKILQVTNCYNHFLVVDHLNLDEFKKDSSDYEETIRKVA